MFSDFSSFPKNAILLLCTICNTSVFMCKIVIPQYIAYVKSDFPEEGAPLILRSSFASRATIFQSTPWHGFNSFTSNCRLERVIF